MKFWALILAGLFLLSPEAADETAVSPVNLDHVCIYYNGLAEGESASFSIGEVTTTAEDNHYPIFVNGSLLRTTFAYDGETAPLVNTAALAEAFGMRENPAPEAEMPYDEAAALLGVHVSFYDAANADAWEGHTQTDGAPYYLTGIPHLMFWQYPADAEALTASEAVETARTVLITAYENLYGTYIPLTEVSVEDRYTDEVWNNLAIGNLAVSEENDRFWRIPYVYDFLVDKYTGEVYTYYNGMAEIFSRFDPLADGALTFAG